MTLIVNTKNKREETILKAFLNSLKIGFHSEADEDIALHNAMQKGRKTALLNKTEKEKFIKKLKKSKWIWKSRSFVKDVEKLPASTKVMIEKVIQEIILKNKLSELSSCKKLSGFKTAYRIRLGNFRIGFFYEKNTVELVRVLDRKNMYKYFP